MKVTRVCLLIKLFFKTPCFYIPCGPLCKEFVGISEWMILDPMIIQVRPNQAVLVTYGTQLAATRLHKL